MASIALNKAGISNTVYEKAAALGEAGAGLALWPNATGILSQYGLMDALMPHCSVMQEVETLNSRGRTLNKVRVSKVAETFGAPVVVLLRSTLQQTLLRALPGQQVHFSKGFVKLEQTAKGYVAHFADGSSANGDAVIFADGIHSSARQSHFQLPALKYGGRMSWRGIADANKGLFDKTRNYEILGRGRRIGIFPLPDNKVYWFAAVNMDEAAGKQQVATSDCVSSHFPGWGDAVSALFSSTPPDRFVLTQILLAPKPLKLVNGSIALLGDAAHPITPDLGQGACQAIEDAFVMAKSLAQHKSVPEGFTAYEAKRLARVQLLWKNSFAMGRMKQMGNPLMIAGRNLIYRIVPEKAALRMLTRNIEILT